MKQILGFNFKRFLCLSFIVTMLLAAFFSNLPVSADQAAAPKIANPVLQYSMNKTYVYHWDVDLTARYHGKRIIDIQTGEIEYVTEENKSRLEGVARVTTYSIPAPGEYMMAMKVVQPRFYRFNDLQQEVEEVDPILNTELERPIFFKQNSTGLVTEFYVYPGEDPGATNIKKGIISALQTHLYGDTTGVITGTPEVDASGAYVPQYSSQGGSQFQTITRTRNQSSYTQLANGAAPTAVAQAVTIDETALTNFNTVTGKIQDVTINSHIISTGVQDTILPNDGAGMWSESLSTNSLTFNSEEFNAEPFSMSGYVMGSLIATNTVDIDDPIVVQGALAQLAVNSYDTNSFNRLVKGLCDNPAEIRQIREAFKNGTINPLMHHAIIGALTALGTPEAQEILIQDIILKPGISDKSKGQAVVALGLVKTPTEEALCTLETIGSQQDNEVSTQALLMLGAAAEKLSRTNSVRATQIVKNLEFSLLSSTQEQDIDLYLGALGNAGFNSSLDAIASYLSHQSPIIRHAAVTALRKINSSEARTYLLRVLATETENSVRNAAETIYKQYALSDDDISFVMTHYEWPWELKIGNGDVYGKIFAKLTCDDGNNFTITGEGEARAYAWGSSFSLVRANALSDVVNQGGVLKRRFLARAYLLGNQVYTTGDVFLNCGFSQEATPWEQTVNFFNISYSFYPYGIKVTVGVSAGGNVKLKYKFVLNACNAPVIADASVTGSAIGSVKATGEASVSIYVAKAGVTLSVDIFKTTVSALAQAIARTSAPLFQRHFKVTLEMQGISGKLDLWAKVRKLWGGWKTVFSATLWSFGSNPYTQTIIDQWY